MDNNFYQERFESALAACRDASPASSTKPADPALLFFAGPVLGAIAFKVYKAEWASEPHEPLTSPGRIFFSVWVTEKSIQQNQLLYNIHALKLRQFKTHRITSRDFAARFRALLEPYQRDWPNISLDFGPLTLMQGWAPLDPDTLVADIKNLVQKFEKLSPLIDRMLGEYRL